MKALFSAGMFLVLDFVTKLYATLKIPYLDPAEGFYPFGGVPLFFSSAVTFSLNTVTNTGAAWGLFPGRSGALFALRLAIIGGLFLHLWLSKERVKWPLWLIVTGAVGNVIDYIVYGHVIDFFHWTFWGYSFPIFNFADVYISLGVAALFILPKRKISVVS